MDEGLILKLSCPDKPGLVAQIACYASEFEANLVELNQFTDRERGRFFARLEIDTSKLQVPLMILLRDLTFLENQWRQIGTFAVFLTKCVRQFS